MRVGVVALQHETNTFIEAPTDLEAFRGGLLATGDAFRDAVEGSNHELAGFFAGLDEVRIPVKKATHSGNKKPPGGWSDPDTATIAGWLF